MIASLLFQTQLLSTFTKELEIHRSLTFLDVFREKTNSGIKTSTYHKPTKTNLLTKYTSFSPLHYKRNLVKNLLQRSYSICNSYITIGSEFQSIKNILLKNEYRYPLSFIDKCMRQFFKRKFNPKRPKQSQTKPSTYLLFRLVYSLGSICHHIEKELPPVHKNPLARL